MGAQLRTHAHNCNNQWGRLKNQQGEIEESTGRDSRINRERLREVKSERWAVVQWLGSTTSGELSAFALSLLLGLLLGLLLDAVKDVGMKRPAVGEHNVRLAVELPKV